MASKLTFATAGDFLFRWRSYTPVVVFPLYYLGYGQSFLIPNVPGLENVYLYVAGALVVLGELGRMFIVGFVPAGTSGRNTSVGQVADKLNTLGAYSVTRNPLYFSNFLMFMGIVMTGLSEWLLLVNAAIFLLVYRAIIEAEETYLGEKFGQAFADFQGRVPRFWPRPGLWQPPQRRFLLGMVILREHDTSMAGLIFFALCRHLGLYMETGRFEWQTPWLIAIAIAVVPYTIAKGLTTFTKVLHPKE